MQAESEPYVRLATLRTLHRVVADLNAAPSLPGTLQAVVAGAVTGLGFEAAAVNLVRPDGDLVVAAVREAEERGSGGPGAMLGRIAPREAWERLLGVGEHWGTLRFVPYDRGWACGADLPVWVGDETWAGDDRSWHPRDMLLAPMYSAGGELLGVLSVDRPRSGRRPGSWTREALEMYSLQAGIAIGNSRLRAEMQRAMARLEREQQALRASEESFRQAFEYAPSGMAITELHGHNRGRLVRVNDALCRLLGRPRAVLRQQTFADLVHPDDLRLLQATPADGGRAELRISRREGGHQWVCLRNSLIADASEGPRFLLTHVEDIEERKRRELQLAHWASHDALTGLPNGAELRSRLSRRLCGLAPGPARDAAREKSGAGPGGASEGVSGGEGTGGAAAGTGFGMGPGFSSTDLAVPGYPVPARDPCRAEAPGCEHVHAVLPEAACPGAREKGLAVIFCDLDGFKAINDRFGHNAGDATLIEVARRLQQVVREGDTVARLGGDEFVVLADGIGREEAKDLAGRLRTAIVPPMRIEGRSVRVGVSLGIGWAGCGMTIDEVLRSADELMYEEKRSRSGPQRPPAPPRGGRGAQHAGSRSHRRAG